MIEFQNPDIQQEYDEIKNTKPSFFLKGQYILTGTGKISRVLMRLMSLFESNESTGEVSFADILEGKDISGVSKLSLDDLANIIVRGGWPASINVKSNLKYSFTKD